ncbi:heme A synthase [Corynebacterium uropygiale]|uniref:Heme A synthase n=1 Tax=Corynebacterium uropygiale TaxID=1775911 RepID=A0A9X1QS89_9CORY|nr:heme A synthase [Corynebacterium uropygiale]MCF4006599.1 heme A synthase [Corynebacterium uropygiale]
MTTQRRLALILLLCQGGITGTGATVRVTSSGLGCPTWPECHPGSLVPQAGATPWIHQLIEFGNRLLTFVLAAAAVALIVALWRARRRDELMILGWISLAGVVVQAIIGGISVWLNLAWWAVALHFLPSMVLVWVAAILYLRITQLDDGIPERTYPSIVRWFTVISAIALSVVLVTGTMVTGAGVHSGDDTIGLEGRLDVDISLMAHIHAYCMYTYLALTIILVAILFMKKATSEARTFGICLILCILIQGAIGIMQFRLGVPRWTVPFHILMSSVVVAVAGFLYAAGFRRVGGLATVTGSPEGERLR